MLYYNPLEQKSDVLRDKNNKKTTTRAHHQIGSKWDPNIIARIMNPTCLLQRVV